MTPDHLTRPTDPDTSLAAAVKAARASSRAVDAVRRFMSDGQPRIDDEIHVGVWANGPWSFDVTRHAWLALARQGVLVETGRRRNTTTGRASSREWMLSSAEMLALKDGT